MKNFFIKDLEVFSGIKAHTLRIWEQRYNILNPQRRKGNLRYYSLADVRKVLNIAVLNKNGYKISFLSKLSPSQVEEKLSGLTTDEDKQQIAINDLLISMYIVDVDEFETILDRCFISWPISDVINKVIYPFLKKTDLLWQGSRITEEHLVVTAIRKKLLWGIEKIDTVNEKNKIVLLFLPDTKGLDLGLLYTNYVLKLSGKHVIYMGNDVSIDNLKILIEKIKPQFLYTYLHKKSNFQIDELVSLIEKSLSLTQIIITSPIENKLTSHPSNNLLHMNYDNAISFLRQ